MAEEAEIPGSYRWVFVGGPRGGEVNYNETGVPGTIDGDGANVYQLQTNPEYVPDLPAAKDVTVSVYAWVPADPIVDDPGDPLV